MSSPLPPVPSPAAGLPLPVAAPVSGPAAGAPVAPQAPSAAVAPASPASPASPSIPVTPPAATAVRWSPEMLQSLRLQAFEQLVAQLARQVQSSPGAPAPQWPASGVSEALGRLLEALLAQVGPQQGQALQLLAAQPGSAALLQALATGTTAGTAAAGGQAQPSQSPQTAASASAQAGAAPQAASSSPALQAAASLQPSAAAVTLAVAAAKAKVVDALLAGSGLAPQAGASAPGGVAGGATQTLPALQSWWVQQGTLLTPQGERGFTLSLQVPQAWAQAQGAAMALAAASASAPGAAPFTAAALPAGAALPLAGAQATEPGLRLPLDASLQSLASGPVAVVVQPRGADALRTSALLLLELQPLRQPGGAMASPAGLASVASLSPALAQEVQQMLQQRNDPWLHMAAAQASGALPRERRAFEHQSHFCTTEGCQYEGRAPCAQPFCSEMNRLWDVSRTERSR
ncbi:MULTISPECIES: Fe-S oxidoreductase [unclassified Delftia]|uniref:Fe-S oxidoreductase n=1 Tax=unclassified Delftia TaxID=2613839 RepID=UPI0018FF464C|nr:MULTISPECIES: Fe-S oxidoreductase [unclassified Delftia]MBK0110777.1 Fe-S oxidoreductase [Delftia sp. S65]MBK0116473.1 Fe-S oxidoreductase [Delftia sp. S67]MBK0128594.1 Fe-S oxidoreductase [Delftia sp. S66]